MNRSVNASIGWIFIVLSILISGCGSSSGEVETPLPSATVEVSTPSPEPSPTVRASATATAAPTETQYIDPVFGLTLEITAGTYQQGIYTPANGLFSCDFGNVINGVPYPNLFDNVEGENFGAVWSMDGYGGSFAIDYFRYSGLSPEMKALLEDPLTREAGYLKLFTDMLMPFHQNNFPGLDVLEQGFVDDETLYVVWNKPGGSHLYSENAYEDVQEIYYIMGGGDWFYFISSYRTPSVWDTEFDVEQMRDRIDDFLAGCEFNS